ncbi:MAG: hypothetical protein M0Z46_09335 [Actinomycetota bacterium]|jgi:glucarate dehydratase|nr:hypothetical protein [Actinomycetota bacterium]
MRITDVEAWSVAVPFRNPIQSAYGISYPARLRVIVRITTDEGVAGLGETGPEAVSLIQRDDLAPRFLERTGPRIIGADPFRMGDILRTLGYAPDAVAVELACLDIVAKTVGKPVAEVLGGVSAPRQLPVAAYCFFRLPDQSGAGEVGLDNFAESVVHQAQSGGFHTVKLKLGVYQPEAELECLEAVRGRLPGSLLRIDPNGAWSVETSVRLMRRLAALDLEYVEDPIKDSPHGYQQAILGGRSIDVPGMSRLRITGGVPICADNCYRRDLLRDVIRGGAADVVLADVFGCGGIRATVDWYRTADLFHLGLGMHSGTELGIGQAAKMQAIAAMGGRASHAMDAIFPEYVGDIVKGNPFEIRDGAIEFPKSPGLGVELDEGELARFELTEAKHKELDAWWLECRRVANIRPALSSLLVRQY